jgi:hypothetical protein
VEVDECAGLSDLKAAIEDVEFIPAGKNKWSIMAHMKSEKPGGGSLY